MFFSDIKVILEQYEKGESSFDDVKSMAENIKVEIRIPIIKKYAIISNFQQQLSALNLNAKESTIEELNGYYLTYDIGIAFSILNAYAGIISSTDERNTQNYDLIMSTGFYDLILKNSVRDVEEFTKIAERVCGVNNLWILAEIDEIFCQTTNVENMQKIADLLNHGLDKGTLDKLAGIQLLNNPSVNSLVSKLQKETMNETMNRQ